MNEWDRRLEKKPVTWSILWLIGGTIFFLLFIWGIVLASFGLRVATAGIFGAGNAKIQIQSAPFRIAAYETFFNQCASIQGLEFQIDALRQQLANTSESNKDRVSISLAGTIAARGASIAQYNQDSAKEYTEGQFRDSDLPFQIPNTTYKEDGSNKTKCATK